MVHRILNRVTMNIMCGVSCFMIGTTVYNNYNNYNKKPKTDTNKINNFEKYHQIEENLSNPYYYSNFKRRDNNLNLIADLIECTMHEIPESVDYDREVDTVCDKIKAILKNKSNEYLKLHQDDNVKKN